ncbi:threonine ammonia-lyase [Cochlodiniinecator piscidefendens]|uniref:threonine ammonia-lyase n=1 Tax=Cochlodiniinecator piscidefendens TaxID=2715756 RepID=UPI001407F3A1|nr:threonine/serine dehydratase [Cochlodiniinecator piscidefendens]
MSDVAPLTLNEISDAEAILADQTIRTPVLDLRQTGLERLLPEGASVQMKMELFQKAGSFKARGNYLSVHALSPEERSKGVVAASGGNHALALSWAARAAGVSAKIAVPRAADPIRIQGCEALGAEVILCDTIGAAFETMQEIAEDEVRALVHPFEGRLMSLGAATCGKEFFEDARAMDIVVLPVGGGGLISGMASALKLLNPRLKIYGVEPFGADTMFRSFEAGSPQSISQVDTIADSLGAPMAMPISYALTRANVDGIVRVSDDALVSTMRIMSESLNLLPEPACAAALTAVLGPLHEDCKGKSVGVIACGANISLSKFNAILES